MRINNHYINGFFNDIEVLGSNPLDIIGLLDPVDRLTSLDPWPVAIPFVVLPFRGSQISNSLLGVIRFYTQCIFSKATDS
jgi:hypothetical protein